jgi:MarR family transcriptional regulator, transcriptional regulator for hemolysin
MERGRKHGRGRRELTGRVVSMTAKEGRAVFEARLQAVGGSFTTWMVLHTLEDKDGQAQRHLAESCHIEGPTLTHHLDNLEAEGLIERRPDPGDRRVTRVYLTGAGTRLLAMMWEVAERAESDLTKGLSGAEVDLLHAFHGRLLENVRAAAERDRLVRERAIKRSPARTKARTTTKSIVGE